jgi:hypothetical protein
VPKEIYLEGKNKRNGMGSLSEPKISLHGIVNHGLRYDHLEHSFVLGSKGSMERSFTKVLYTYDASLQ